MRTSCPTSTTKAGFVAVSNKFDDRTRLLVRCPVGAGQRVVQHAQPGKTKNTATTVAGYIQDQSAESYGQGSTPTSRTFRHLSGWFAMTENSIASSKECPSSQIHPSPVATTHPPSSI